MIARVAAEATRRFGDRTAYVAAAGWGLTYGELDRVSDDVAAGLASLGIGEGDVVSPVLPTIPEFPVLYLAAAKVGAITAAVNTRLASGAREAVLETAAPALVIATEAYAPDGPWTTEVIEPAGSAAELLPSLRPGGDPPDPLPEDPDRPIAIVFTSGTTGRPKGAVFAGRQLDFVTRTDTGWRWGEGGDTLAGTSLAHLAFLTKFPGKLVGGAVTHLMERWSAGEALRLTADHGLARLGGIPTQMALMLRHPGFDAHDLSGVKLVVIGGGPATPALVREARERLGCPVLVRYSCTEAAIGTGTNPSDPPEDAEVSVGRPQPGVDLRIADPDDAGIGEVCLRSPAAMSGYWNDPDATAAAFTGDGCVRTGDLGRIDDAGRLVLTGRAKEMYVRGGYNVYPMAVEAVLSRHPDVTDVAVVPRPDDVMGEIGVAVVVARTGRVPTLEALRSFAADHLAKHELPEDLRVVADLPLTAMEKVDRPALAALVQTDTPSEDT